MVKEQFVNLLISTYNCVLVCKFTCY